MYPDLPLSSLSLFLDVDGTLIDIAERPQDVIVPSALLRSLYEVNAVLEGAVALVSGRTIADIDALFGPLRLSASGVHGAEIRMRPGDPPFWNAGHPLPQDLIDAVRASATAFKGTIVEDKRYSVALHYRQVPDAQAPLQAALEGLIRQREHEGLKILPGHMVFEVKRATFDKGTAIRHFMSQAPFAGRTPVFLGDDVTDRPGFDAVMQMGGYAFSVGHSIPGLSGSFPNPTAVRHWIAGLCQLETSPG